MASPFCPWMPSSTSLSNGTNVVGEISRSRPVQPIFLSNTYAMFHQNAFVRVPSTLCTLV